MISLIIIFVVLVIFFIFLKKKCFLSAPEEIFLIFCIPIIVIGSWGVLGQIPSTYTETTTKYNIDLTNNTLIEVNNEYYYVIKLIDKDCISKVRLISKHQTTIIFGKENKLIVREYERCKCTRNLFIPELDKPDDEIELIINTK